MYVALVLAASVLSASGAPSSERQRIPIHGVVLRPDGTPAPGASVEAVATCPGAFNLAAQAIAASDGRFSIAGFPPDCTPVTLRASLLSEFWLKTGADVFFAMPNGSSPVVRPVVGAPPTIITLGARGGRVEFEVWDEATGKPLRATVSFSRVNVMGRDLGVLQTATGPDGQSHYAYLPAGDYVAHIDWYRCGAKSLFPSQAAFTLAVAEGVVRPVRLVVNTREMETTPSAENPRAEKCAE